MSQPGARAQSGSRAPAGAGAQSAGHFRSCGLLFEPEPIPRAPIGGSNRSQKHPAGHETDSDSARRDAYDERFLRHRSSPSVPENSPTGHRQIFKRDTDKRFFRHRTSPAVLKIQRVDNVKFSRESANVVFCTRKTGKQTAFAAQCCRKCSISGDVPLFEANRPLIVARNTTFLFL